MTHAIVNNLYASIVYKATVIQKTAYYMRCKNGRKFFLTTFYSNVCTTTYSKVDQNVTSWKNTPRPGLSFLQQPRVTFGFSISCVETLYNPTLFGTNQ